MPFRRKQLTYSTPPPTPPQITVTPSKSPTTPESQIPRQPLAPSTLPRRTSSRLIPRDAATGMLALKRASAFSPISHAAAASSIPRPSSVTSQRGTISTRRNSDAASQTGLLEPEGRNVRVVLRIRPSDPDDASIPPRFQATLVHPISDSDVRVDVDPATLAGNSTASSSGIKRHPTFAYDHVLGEESSQLDLYDVTAKDSIDEFLKGHNVTFFAYGQTSSGKSYSMGTTGDDDDYNGASFTPRTGLIPRTVQTIFEKAEEIRRLSGLGSSWECRLSFLELYNEEIIDLLSGNDISISVREERDGRIVWSGIREVKVKTLAEVMDYLYEGSARRKTGATGMNSSSSRSHAIFSLTMVQRRKSGPPAPAGSLSPNLESGRSLKRPSSTLGFSSSASGRTTPSGSRAPPSSFIKSPTTSRPVSMSPSPSSEGDFMVVTSKFNMVDLAGSERLKRTAAQGERMKEGISINSGLLALGNVISHLADPIKSKGHIPYRDSKLTRMLQDSIGGNSITTMIACISGIEYNVSETLNTMKYASRARAIKNSTKINAVEAGWDDVEHLQSTVLRLRKQLVALETDGPVKADEKSIGRSNENLLQRLADLQREHTELYDRYLAKCSESMRLTSELKNAKPGDADAIAKFNETVEPVIIEYEKVVSALNKQLDGLRAELTNLSDMHEEQSSHLADASARHVENDAYLLELRGRLNKMQEHNASSEVYIHDLEAKLKAHVDKADGHYDIVSDLRKELAVMKEANVKLDEHATNLEVQLSKSEIQTTSLVAQIQKHEKMAQNREEAYRDLEKHIASLNTSNDNKALLEELEAKNTRIGSLEACLQQQTFDGNEERSRLLAALEAEKAVQSQLRSQVSTNGLRAVSSVSSFKDPRQLAPPQADHLGVKEELTPPESPKTGSETSDDETTRLRAALAELAARCTKAESSYHQAQEKITELNGQLSEARLIRAEMDDVVPLSSVPTSAVETEGGEGARTTPETPPKRPSPSRRSSVPILSAGEGSRKDFRSGRGLGESRIRPLSLSQELSSAQSSPMSSRTSWAGPSNSLLGVSPSKRLSQTRPLKSPQSLEAELKFVHKIVEERDEELRDREAYIRQLEDTLRSSHIALSRSKSANDLSSTLVETPKSTRSALPAIRKDSFVEQLADSPHDMSPQSTKRFQDLKDSISHLEEAHVMDPEAQKEIDNLLREMAIKERSQREIIEQQFVQIADLQKSNNRLKEELYADYPTMPAELEELRKERDGKAEELDTILRSHAETIENLRRDHSAAIEEIRSSFENARQEYQTELDGSRESHEQILSDQKKAQKHALDQAAQDSEALVNEMEQSLASSEEQRRQLKMRADQTIFELSRIKDEYSIQRSGDVKQISDLQRANGRLEQVRIELENANADLAKRVSDMENRYSLRKPAALPPQGPPPTAPLPPLPPTALPSPIFRQPSTDLSTSSHRSSGSTALTSIQEIEGAVAQMPEGVGHVIHKVVAERDSAVHERETLRQRLASESERHRDTEQRLSEEQTKAEGLSKDLHDAKKTGSKLRAHLEDARQETKRVSEECRDHMNELEDHRSRVTKMSQESGNTRDSLMAANAQVATLRAQLDRAVETKVNKKLNQRLKCF